MYFVAFVDDIRTPFDPALHAVTDLEVLSLRISQSEGQFASCEIEIINPGILEIFEMKTSNMIISNDEDGTPEVMFRGTLLSIPTALSGDTVTLELIAEAPDSKEKMREMATANAQVYMDPIFVDEAEAPLEDLILGQAVHFYVDRRTLQESLSNDIADETHPVIYPTAAIFDKSLKVNQVGQIPPTKVKQRVEVEWIQRRSGKVDLKHVIQSRLPTDNIGTITTLTPEALVNTLPGLGGSMLEGSGYTFDDPDYVINEGGSYDIRTKAFTDPNGDTHWSTIRAQHSSVRYKTFGVSFDYQQPRAEVIEIEVSCKQPKLFGSVERVEDLETLVATDITRDELTDYWRPRKVYYRGNRVQHNGEIYECLIDHKSSDGFRNVDTTFAKLYWSKVERTNAPLEYWHRSTFIHTERGKQAIDFAVNFAAAELKRRSRFIELSFTAQFEELKDIDTNMRVRLDHPLIPGGWSEGKVTQYEIVDSGSERYVNVVIATALGGVEGQELPPPEGAYVDYEYDRGAIQALATENRQTTSGVEYQISGDDVIEPVNPYFLSSPSYLVAKCEMTSGGIEEQLAQLRYWVGSQNVAVNTPKFKTTQYSNGTTTWVDYSLDKQAMTNELASGLGGFTLDEYGSDAFPTPTVEMEMRDLSSNGLLTTTFKVEGFLHFASGMEL